MILFIMINNTPDNNHDNSNNEIMRIFFFGHQSLKKKIIICQRAQRAYCSTGNRFFQAVVIMNVKMTEATKCSFVIHWSNH